jgi:GT2 family glycosyltransferase
MPPSPQRDIAIVIPAYDAAEQLPAVVPAARKAAGESEVIVVDAGSTDRTGELAARLGARVIRLPERAGPALARNRGVAAVDSEVVLFLDADCVPHPDVVKRVREAFAADPDLVGLTGSYDSDPPDPGFFSQYMNLRHHYTHQVAQRENATFWAGCGAVRRRAFLDVGGFDAERFPRPQIEDIELGLRLAERGKTRLDPELQVTHLKRWTLRSVVETDVRQRAVPWARLILERGRLPNDLNLRLSQRVAAAVAPLALAAVLAAPLAATAGSGLVLAASLGALAASIALNGEMLRFFARRRGLAFAAGAWLFHQVHLVYSSATLVVCFAARRLRPRPESAP